MRLPEVPVTVTVIEPVVAEALAVNVKVLVPVVGLGLNKAVTPVGSAEVESETLPAKPLAGVTVIVVPAPGAP